MLNSASKSYKLHYFAPKCIVSPNKSMGAINNNGFVCLEMRIKVN